MRLYKNKVKVNLEVAKSPAQPSWGMNQQTPGEGAALRWEGSWAGSDSGSVVSDLSKTVRIYAVPLDLLLARADRNAAVAGSLLSRLPLWGGRRRQPQAGLAGVAEAGVLSSVAQGNLCCAQLLLPLPPAQPRLGSVCSALGPARPAPVPLQRPGQPMLPFLSWLRFSWEQNLRPAPCLL